MSDELYVMLTNDAPEGEQGDWIRADVVLNGKIVTTGFAPERPPYVDGTARSSAVSMALIKFQRTVGSDQRPLLPNEYKEKQVRGPS